MSGTHAAGKSRRLKPGKMPGQGAKQRVRGRTLPVLAQVSALQSEIDRLIALVNAAAKKLEG